MHALNILEGHLSLKHEVQKFKLPKFKLPSIDYMALIITVVDPSPPPPPHSPTQNLYKIGL